MINRVIFELQFRCIVVLLIGCKRCSMNRLDFGCVLRGSVGEFLATKKGSLAMLT